MLEYPLLKIMDKSLTGLSKVCRFFMVYELRFAVQACRVKARPTPERVQSTTVSEVVVLNTRLTSLPPMPATTSRTRPPEFQSLKPQTSKPHQHNPTP